MSHLYSPPPPAPLAIVHCDAALIVVDKPAGLLSVPGRGADKQDCMASRLQREFPEALTVHRLDMETSGLLVFARDRACHRMMSLAFQDRAVQKSYVAVVEGLVTPQSGEIDLPLLTDWPRRPLQKVDHALGKPSLTHYEVQSHDAANGTSRLALEPLTGRSHQLRVHLLSIGHPIIGDALYGNHTKASRLMLHACALQFRHPVSGEALSLQSAPDF